MNRRALAIAAFLAACFTALLVVYLNRFEREMSGGDKVALLTVVKPVPRGAVITDDMLATRKVPLAYVEDRAVKAAERAKVLGLEASTTLSPQETLLWTDLAITTEERDLSALVRPGKRAVTVHAGGFNDSPGNALIRPGDYVDVLLTSLDSKDPKDQSTMVLLQRILVLAVGQETSGMRASGDQRGVAPVNQDKVLTLSLSLADAQILALALEKGRLIVAVRNASDPAVQTDMPDVNASMLFTGRARTEAPAVRAAPAGPVAIGGPR
ncbi:MAG TPA: Flp pilus assembly protein CpaB [Polyangiaceae bacterium]|nr:Flp pilus assembly protein CpaB [Polyangiaceae bacterium]